MGKLAKVTNPTLTLRVCVGFPFSSTLLQTKSQTHTNPKSGYEGEVTWFLILLERLTGVIIVSSP